MYDGILYVIYVLHGKKGFLERFLEIQTATVWYSTMQKCIRFAKLHGFPSKNVYARINYYLNKGSFNYR